MTQQAQSLAECARIYTDTERLSDAIYTALTPQQEELINGRYIPDMHERIYYQAFRSLPEWRPFCDNPAHDKWTVIAQKEKYGYCCACCGRKWNIDMTPRD